MKLEEAKEILNSIDVIDLRETHDVTEETYNLAIETVLQEIETLQRTTAELQKENEELRVLKYKIIDKIEEKRKALRHRTPIEEILEYEFVKLRDELLKEE